MLAKLMKYDFRAFKKYGFPMLFCMLGAIVVGMLNSWVMGAIFTGAEENGSALMVLMRVVCMLFGVAIVFALYGCVMAIMILSLVHFYKSLVTDEGYLTFTLPVKANRILLSKVLNGALWHLIIGVVAIVGIFVVVFGMIMSSDGRAELATLFANIPEIFQMMLGETAVVTGILYLLLIIAGVVYSQMLYYMVIFFASVVSKKNKVLVSIGCIIGAYFASSLISSIVTVFVSIFVEVIASAGKISDAAVINLMLSIYLVLLIGASALFYFLTIHMMKKKLNLP